MTCYDLVHLSISSISCFSGIVVIRIWYSENSLGRARRLKVISGCGVNQDKVFVLSLSLNYLLQFLSISLKELLKRQTQFKPLISCVFITFSWYQNKVFEVSLNRIREKILRQTCLPLWPLPPLPRVIPRMIPICLYHLCSVVMYNSLLGGKTSCIVSALWLTKMSFEQCLWSFDDDNVWKNNWIC